MAFVRKAIFSQIVEKFQPQSLFSRMLGKILQLNATALLVFFVANKSWKNL